MKLLKKHILGLFSFWALVLININPKLTFVQSMFSSIDMTPSTPEIKTGFSEVKEYILTWYIHFLDIECVLNKENRIYIRVELTRKKCKTAILLYCFHTAGVLHIFVLYNLLGPGTSFYRKSKINIKRNPNYEIGRFHNWPMIISHRLYAFHFTNDDFPLYI